MHCNQTFEDRGPRLRAQFEPSEFHVRIGDKPALATGLVSSERAMMFSVGFRPCVALNNTMPPPLPRINLVIGMCRLLLQSETHRANFAFIGTRRFH